MNDFTSSCVGQDFWHGASTHFRHLVKFMIRKTRSLIFYPYLADSFKAALSLSVVCLMSSKFLYSGLHELHLRFSDLSSFRFQCFFAWTSKMSGIISIKKIWSNIEWLSNDRQNEQIKDTFWLVIQIKFPGTINQSLVRSKGISIIFFQLVSIGKWIELLHERWISKFL